MPYRRTFYLLSIIIQVFLIIIFVLHFGYVLGRYGSYVSMTDNVIAFIYLGIMLIATIYQFRSPYHETKASIYLALFYFSPLILLGLLILMNPGETQFVTHALSPLIQTTYLFNGVIHVLSIFGKEL